MKTFEEIELIGPLHKALAEEDYETPTPIQAQTIPAALDGRDVLGCAQTGTGKTAAFALPILNRLGAHPRRAISGQPFALVLAPTRELAIQIGASFDTYGRHLKLRKALVYGGVSQHQQVKSLQRGSHILIATPGRLLDLMDQGHINLERLETFVLDEADRMLDMGFLPDLTRIIQSLPVDRQSLFFSATVPSKIVQLAGQLLTDPIHVKVTPKSGSHNKIEQQIRFVERSEKLSSLHQILACDEVRRVIVFTRTKRSANTLEKKLKQSGVNAAAIHGNKSQPARQRTLDAFRRDRIQVLVATDVAARGIDVDDITHVINFDVPTEPESYVHRIGRTGRAGAAGIAITFCTADERRHLRDIERFINRDLSGEGGREPGREKRKQRPGKSRRRATAGSTKPHAKKDANTNASKRARHHRRKPRVKQCV